MSLFFTFASPNSAPANYTLPILTFIITVTFVSVSIVLFIFDIPTVPFFLAFISVPFLFCTIIFICLVLRVEINLNSDHNRFFVKKTPVFLARIFCRKEDYTDGRISDIHDILGFFGEYRSVESGGTYSEQGDFVPDPQNGEKEKKITFMIQLRNGHVIDASGRFKTGQISEAVSYVETFKKWRRNFLIAFSNRPVISEYEINANAYLPIANNHDESQSTLLPLSPESQRNPSPSPRFPIQYNTWQYYRGNKNDTDLHYVPAPPLILPSAPVDERIVRVQ
ncbi:hypothetical protein BLNAU_15067 [Blattamonas nauphoetae]|uniref:Transmembrane protein n=1 Tax=Blattamonas nauphoetae TaxID=2049346 RepID=A0ABQ9XBZ2_9EUKA|nr:hypothetical protein BLNAU_15067 [Blattamonas nauphoetae]